MKKHPFFAKVDWTNVLDKKVKPPFKNPKDTFVSNMNQDLNPFASMPIKLLNDTFN